MRALILLTLVLPQSAAAACVGETLFSCPVEGSSRVIEMCLRDDVLTYRFGPPGKPEIELTEPLAAATYEPWTGVGRAISETVGFRNQGYTYYVSWALDRLEKDHPVYGGVTVFDGKRYVATFDCKAGTPGDSFEPRLTEAMREVGLCWSLENHMWSGANCN